MKRRTFKRALPVALGLALVGGGVTLVGSTPAEAHDSRARGDYVRYDRHDRHDHRRDNRHRARDVKRARHFQVPRSIRHNRDRFDGYFLGRYDTRRWGTVRIYEFPVRRHGRTEWIPHAYKRGHLVTSGDWMYRRVLDRGRVCDVRRRGGYEPRPTDRYEPRARRHRGGDYVAVDLNTPIGRIRIRDYDDD